MIVVGRAPGEFDFDRDGALRDGMWLPEYSDIARVLGQLALQLGQFAGRDDVAEGHDAAARGVDRSRVLLAGFSRGGSMVWDVACHAPVTARAYAPVAGAFWEPLPASCQGGADLFQTHGWADRVIPLEGRSVAGGRWIRWIRPVPAA